MYDGQDRPRGDERSEAQQACSRRRSSALDRMVGRGRFDRHLLCEVQSALPLELPARWSQLRSIDAPGKTRPGLRSLQLRLPSA